MQLCQAIMKYVTYAREGPGHTNSGRAGHTMLHMPAPRSTSLALWVHAPWPANMQHALCLCICYRPSQYPSQGVCTWAPCSIQITGKTPELSRLRYVVCRSTQFLTWLLLPFFQYYSVAGDFSVKNKWVAAPEPQCSSAKDAC